MRPWVRAVEMLAVGGMALLPRLIHLDHAPYVDELNQVLAAKSLLEQGNLQIGDGGVYTRAWLYTHLVAGFFRAFGETLVVGRLPAVLAGAGLVLAVFTWLRLVAGRGPAWIAAILLTFSPGSLYLSQQVRFYPLQALLFWAGAVAVYRLASHPVPKRLARALLGAAAILAFSLAIHLQVTTLVGMAGLLLWLLLVSGPSAARWASARPRRATILGALLVAGLLLALPLLTDAWTRAVALFRYADLWAEGDRDSVAYYHWLFLDQYATLWTLFPLWVVIAGATRPRPTAFCVCVFATAFVIHSLAAWKSERYLFYAFPFFFAVSAIGIFHLAVRIWPLLESAIARVRWGGVSARARTGATLLLVGAGTFAAVGNGAFSYARKMLMAGDADWDLAQLYRGEPDWTAAVPALQPLADSSAVLVSSIELKSLFYLGRLDLLLNANYLATPSGRAPEFSSFPKHQRPVVSTPASLRRVVACCPSGLVIVERGQWRRPFGVLPATADFLEEHTEPVPLPARSRLMAFRWSNPESGCSQDCLSAPQ